MKYPKCPNCGTDDYDVNEEGTEGYCIVSCGAVFEIKDGKAKLSDKVISGPLTIPPGIPVGV